MDAHVGESYVPRSQHGADRTSGLLDSAPEAVRNPRGRRPKSSRDQPETAYGVIVMLLPHFKWLHDAHILFLTIHNAPFLSILSIIRELTNAIRKAAFHLKPK